MCTANRAPLSLSGTSEVGQRFKIESFEPRGEGHDVFRALHFLVEVGFSNCPCLFLLVATASSIHVHLLATKHDLHRGLGLYAGKRLGLV